MKKLPIFVVGLILLLSVGAFFYSQNSSKFTQKDNTQPKAQAADKVKLSLPNGKFNQLVPVLASEKGFFKKNNLDVELVRVDKNTVTLLVGGKVDAAAGLPLSYIGAAAQGSQLLWVGTLTNNNRNLLVSYKDAKDIRIAGLQNSSLNRTAMVNRLESLKVDPKNVTFQDLGSEEAKLLAFKTKKVDAINTPKVTWQLYAKKNNIKSGDYKILINGTDDDGSPNLSGLIVQAQFLKDHQAVVENLSKALIEAENWMQSSKDEAADVFAKFSEMPKEDAMLYIENASEDTKSLEFTPSLEKAKSMISLLALDNPKLKDYKVENYISTAVADSLTKTGFLSQYGAK